MKSDEFKTLFLSLLERGLIEESFDGDVEFGENDEGYFIKPDARLIIDEYIKK